MAQPQRQVDVHQDELCPPNKRYALMDANKKIDLEHSLCPNESKILANILQNHPLRFSIAASSPVPWIYLGQTIFHLPQATDNNHDHFVPAPKFSEMVPFYINDLGFTLELRSPSNFKTTGLIQLWQTLCKMFSRCLTTRVTGYDQPPLQIMQMLYCFKQARDKYHNLEDDEMDKSIFNSGKHKDGVGMKIPSWMITDEMKLTENYQMYATVFGVDVPMTQSHPIESTQGTHRTTSAPKTPNPDVAEGESSASRKSTVTDIPQKDKNKAKRTKPSTRLEEYEKSKPKAYTSLNGPNQQKSHEELEAKQNEDKVKEHLMAEEIEKLVERTENVEENIEESPEVEITAAEQHVNVIKEEEESVKDDYELRRREKRKHVEESRNTPSPTTIRSPRIHSTLISLDTEKLQELTVNDPPPSSSTPSSSSPKPKLSASQHILSLFKLKTGHFKRYKSFFDEFQGR
ncbi:hypothetical protein Tco_1555501 [Tanacetum coccineum]